MDKKKLSMIIVTLILLGAVPSQINFAQNQAEPVPVKTAAPTTSPTIYTDPCLVVKTRIADYDFSEITKARDGVIAEIGSIEQKVDSLNEKIPEALAQTEIEALQKRKPEVTNVASNSNVWSRWNVPTSEESREKLTEQLKDQQRLLTDKKVELQCLDAKISKTDTPEQKFKTSMSTIFAILIGLVIMGFFVLSWKDENIRRAIFGGQTGIQFLTLFSIVIAIILFGITGILQDKELAALLGGLSGYILGKYNQEGVKSPPAPATPPPAG